LDEDGTVALERFSARAESAAGALVTGLSQVCRAGRVLRPLVGVCQVLELCLERLIVLALDLKFGLQLIDEQFEGRDLSAQFSSVGGDRAQGSLRLGLRPLRRLSAESGLVRHRHAGIVRRRRWRMHAGGASGM